MLAQYLELSEEANLNNPGSVIIDVSNYDYCLVQPIGADAEFQATIDSGAITSVSDGSASSAINFNTVGGTRLFTGDFATSIGAGNIIRLGVVGRYIKITSVSGAFTKLFVMLAKIS
jgi:hypothetical protein